MRQMRCFWLVLSVGAALVGLAGTSLSGASSSRATECVPGPRAVGGVALQVFCGPATATIHYAGKTIRITNGQCGPNLPGLFSVRVGTLTLVSRRPRSTAFVLYVDGARDRTYRNQRLAFQYAHHHHQVLPNRVTLAGGATRGTFSGLVFGSHVRVTGSFAC
jgi:hypothetical protein